MEWRVPRDGPDHVPHALESIRERYKVDMSVTELRAIQSRIVRYETASEQSVQPVMRLGGQAYLWLIQFKGHWYPAVWHARFREIMTFLPKDAIELRSPDLSRRA